MGKILKVKFWLKWHKLFKNWNKLCSISNKPTSVEKQVLTTQLKERFERDKKTGDEKSADVLCKVIEDKLREVEVKLNKNTGSVSQNTGNSVYFSD